jgi:antitoxin CcdA
MMRMIDVYLKHTHANLWSSAQPGVHMPPSASALFRSLASAHHTCRKATNVSLDAALLAEAKALRINVSQAAEAGLSRAVAEQRAELWLAANREALESSNAYVEAHGLPLARHRQF